MTLRRGRPRVPAALALWLLASGTLRAQTNFDLSVTSITLPTSPAVGAPVTFTANLGPTAGAYGVWATVIFTPAVTFTSGSSNVGGTCSQVTSGGDPTTTVSCQATGASSVTLNVTPLASGNLAVVAGIIGGDQNNPNNDINMSNNAVTANVTVAAVSPPGSLDAHQTGETQITVSWTAPPQGGSFTYELQRRTGIGGAWATIAGPGYTGVSYADNGLSHPAPPTCDGQTYFYQVRATQGSNTSAYTNPPDPAPLFTDYVITQFSTQVKACQVTELRGAIDVVRALHSLGGGSWSPNPLTTGTLIVRSHIQQLRDNLDPAIGAYGYTDNPLTAFLPGQILIKKQHIQEIRDRIK